VVLLGKACDRSLGRLEAGGSSSNTGNGLGVLPLLLSKLVGVRLRRMTEVLVRLCQLRLYLVVLSGLLAMLTLGVFHRIRILGDLRGLAGLDVGLLLLLVGELLGTRRHSGLRLVESSLRRLRVLLLQVGVLGLLVGSGLVCISDLLGLRDLLIQHLDGCTERIKLGLAGSVRGKAIVLLLAVVVVHLRRDHLLDGLLDNTPLGLGVGLDRGLGLIRIVQLLRGEEAAAPREPVLPLAVRGARLHAAFLALQP